MGIKYDGKVEEYVDPTLTILRLQDERDALKKKHRHDVTCFALLAILCAIGGFLLGLRQGKIVAIRDEHCQMVGGAVQGDGSCAKVTIEQVEPAP